MQGQVESFPTKVDRWLAVVLLGGLAILLSASWTAAGTAQRIWELALGVIMPLLLISMVALLSWPTRYELHDQEIVIRSGVVRYRIAYASITRVIPSRSVLSAPAWSLDRLRIDHARGYALISPRDKPGFLKALAARAEHLAPQGNRLEQRRDSG